MQSYRTAASRLRHPVNIALHTNAPLGVRIANAVTGFMGSWKFIILQTVIVALWVAGNVYLLFHFDPYPFIFLNLAFSTQAAYAAPLILLASNQSAVRDRAILEHAALESRGGRSEGRRPAGTPGAHGGDADGADSLQDLSCRVGPGRTRGSPWRHHVSIVGA